MSTNIEKKRRSRIPQEIKVRAALQKEIDSICPFCQNEDVGHFQIHHIDENPSNNTIENLLLLCPLCHSKITKNEISQIDVLRKKISIMNKWNVSTKQDSTAKIINFNNNKIENAIVGDGNNIIIKHTKKKVTNKYPAGCIGPDTNMANYIGHLINRYHEYKRVEVGKQNMKYAIFLASIKKQFSIGSTRTIYNIPIERFEDVCLFIKKRIDGTILGKINKKIHKNYSSFEEYLMK